jgi:TusE/DsrC/DsvC family sulfur relay protein
MPMTAIADREIHVDQEGFLTEFDEWDRQLAETLAANIGITMTGDHWAVVEFMRSDYAENKVTPTLRRVATAGNFPTKQLFVLFPKKPARKMAYIAGLPKPVGCI